MWYGRRHLGHTLSMSSAVVHIESGGRGLAPVELPGPRQPRRPKLFSPRLIASKPNHLPGDVLDILGIHRGRGFATDFPDGTAGRRKDGTTARHGFKWRQAKAFEERGVNKDRCGAIPVRQ